MLKLFPTLTLPARFSVLQVSNKKSFQKLDQRPLDVFQYYLQLQIDQLNVYGDVGDLKHNISFVKRIKNEWKSLSLTKKRVYHTLFFKFSAVDFNKLRNEELARYLTIPRPITSSYLLFRKRFKVRFYQMLEPKERCSQGSASSLDQRYQPTTYLAKNKPLVRIQPRQPYPNNSTAFNAHFRYQEMCKSCKEEWRKSVTEEEKQLLREEVQRRKRLFDLRMQVERKELRTLTKLLDESFSEESFKTLSHSLSYHNLERKKVLDNGFLIPFLHMSHKKD